LEDGKRKILEFETTFKEEQVIRSRTPVHKDIRNALLFVGVKDVLATVICKNKVMGNVEEILVICF
jgi:hypothetical protein